MIILTFTILIFNIVTISVSNRWLPAGGFDVVKVVGLNFNPLTRQWGTSSDLSINYAVIAIKRDLEDIEDEYDS